MVYSFSRPLTQTEWDILRRYTPRVRCILDFSQGLDEKSVSILSNSPITEPLFPNLRWVYYEYRIKSMHLLHLSLPSLNSLNLHFENPHTSRDFLKPLPELFPNIRSLSLETGQVDFAFNKSASNCNCRWKNLRTVICPLIAFHVDALVHLSRMPALTRLDFGLSTTSWVIDSPLFFFNLRDFVLHSESLDPISWLLSRTRLPVITDFTALMCSCPSRQELSSFFASVQTSSAGHTMRGLTFHQSSLQSNVVRSGTPLLCLEDLQPCMAFGNLVHLEFNIEWDVGLTDSDLLTLASAWPRLKHLLINLNSGWNASGGITPDGLLQLLQTCRSLTNVALAIDTRGYTELPMSGSLASLELALPPTLYIDVLDSIIEAESVPAVAAFFASVASCSDLSFGAWRCEKLARPRSRRVYRKRWNDVFRRANDAVRQRS